MSRSRIVFAVVISAAAAADLALWALPYLGRMAERDVSADFNAAAFGAVAVVILAAIPAIRRRTDRRLAEQAQEFERRGAAWAAEMRRREAVLIRAFDRAIRGGEPTGPLPRLYEVPRR